MLIGGKRIISTTNQSKRVLSASLALGIVAILGLWHTTRVTAQDAKVVTLITKDLADIPGKEVLMLTVEYPAGGGDPVHMHNAHGFIYVLEGSVVMQVRGGREVTLTPGQTFYEGPKDIHIVGRSASKTEPAKILVVLLKDKGAPILVPVK